MAAGDDGSAAPVAAPASFVAKHAVLSGAVLQAVVGCFRAPGRQDVVLGRGVSLELLTQRADGSLEVTQRARSACWQALTLKDTLAQSVWEQPVFDTVVDLCVLPWSGADTSAHVRRPASRVLFVCVRAHSCRTSQIGRAHV